MKHSQQTLSDVLYWFSLEGETPTAALIDEYRLRYPEYAGEITKFAIELATDAVGAGVPEFDVETLTGPPSDFVLQSISDFQNARFHATKDKVEKASGMSSTAASLTISNPFSNLSKEQFEQLARSLDVNSVFVSKLRDRQIAPATIPTGFTDFVSKQMKVSEELMIAHLFAERPQAKPSVFYKAVHQPKAQPQETFEEAVRRSGLSGEQQARLLEF